MRFRSCRIMMNWLQSAVNLDSGSSKRQIVITSIVFNYINTFTTIIIIK